MSYLRGVTMAAGLLTFTRPASIQGGGKRVIFATAEGVDAAGNLVATATSSLLVMPPTG